MRNFLVILFFLTTNSLALTQEINVKDETAKTIEEAALVNAKRDLEKAHKELLEAQLEMKKLEDMQNISDDELKQLTDQKALLEARNNALTAEKNILTMQKEIEDARKALEPPTPSEQAQKTALEEAERLTKEAEAKTAIANAEKATSEAEKGAIEAKNAAITAMFGDITSSGLEGAVELKTNAGNAEAALLATKAMRSLTDIISENIKGKIGNNNNVWLISDDNVPEMYNIIGFKVRFQYVINALKSATEKSQTLCAAETFSLESPIVFAGAALESLSKLGSYFQSDYMVGGVDVTILNDEALIDAMAGSLLKENKMIYTPGKFHPGIVKIDLLNPEPDSILQTIMEMASENDKAIEDKSCLQILISNKTKEASLTKTNLANHKNNLTTLTTKGKLLQNELDKLSAGTEYDAKQNELNTNEKDQKTEQAEIKKLQDTELEEKDYLKDHQVVLEKLNAAISIYDAFFNTLTEVKEGKTTNNLTDLVMTDFMINKLKDGDLLLLVNLTSAQGSYYTKKNLWTFFGSMPFYNMGSVVINYRLIEGLNGNVIKADTLPFHGGFYKSSEVEDVVNKH